METQHDNRHTFKTVIFDLDGTLLYTLPDMAEALNKILSENGYPTHPTEAYSDIVGWGIFGTTKNALPADKRSEEEVSRIAALFGEEYKRNPVVYTRPYPGVSNLLDTLVDRGVNMCILSNKRDEITQLVVEKTLQKWNFSFVAGETDGIPKKPDPAGVNRILDTLGLASEDVVLVGDSAMDIKAAINAGVYPAGVLWGYRGRTHLEEAGAMSIFTTPEELLSLF